MLKPFYQGKLDTFCAIYAVLNALRLTHGIRVGKARDILNATIMELAKNPSALNAVLTQDTDYVNLVDGLLATQTRKMPLEVVSPFITVRPGLDEFWSYCGEWLAGQKEHAMGRAIIFRFLRFTTPTVPPLNRHWTTADYMDEEIMHLFDCSHEAEAILNIHKTRTALRREDVDPDHLMYIQPETARFLRLPF